ncbi:DUF4231 domain-containing protein [Paenibacillus elgii]|uniref:DUF4231 domain-containing protein n=1 Tax=Paenibacillus elgii TaxID=189691 RepID=UPI002D7C3DE3|nr:DUF4231 domain-containing protein [Paenibacillus elgii]
MLEFDAFKKIKFSPVQEQADRASVNAQGNYLFLTKLQLLFLFFTTCISLFAGIYKQLFFVILALMIGSFVVTTIVRIRKRERVWYDGRALAESIKTLSWRFMMKAEPFNLKGTEKEDQLKFIDSIRKVLEERKNLSSQLISVDTEESIITVDMKTVRQHTLEERLKLYLNNRIQDQRDWYSKKAKYNRDWESRLFYFSIILQFMSLIYIIWLIYTNSMVVNITPILTSLVTMSITWLQLKQHYELAQAYSIAAHELSIIQSLGIRVSDEIALSEYVNESENAISREHTLWIARRGQ